MSLNDIRDGTVTSVRIAPSAAISITVTPRGQVEEKFHIPVVNNTSAGCDLFYGIDHRATYVPSSLILPSEIAENAKEFRRLKSLCG